MLGTSVWRVRLSDSIVHRGVASYYFEQWRTCAWFDTVVIVEGVQLVMRADGICTEEIHVGNHWLL